MTSHDRLGAQPSGTDPQAPFQLGHIFDAVAQTAPDSTALVAGAERYQVTYAQLAAVVGQLCQRLESAGLQPGDVIGLQTTNSAEFVIGLLSASRANLVVAPLDGALPAEDRLSRLDMAGARAVLVDSHQENFGCGYPVWTVDLQLSPETAPRPRLAADDRARQITDPVPGLTDRDALIMFTSGTTGKPKMVPWTHDNIAASVGGIISAYQLGPSDGTVAVMPLFHGHGLVAALIATLASGGRLLLPATGRFSARTFWDDVQAVDATWYTAVPTIHQILLERSDGKSARAHSGQLRFIRSCSAPLSPATVEKIEQTFGAPLLPAYGMTEATHQTSTARPSDNETTRVNTVGQPTGLAVRIVDDGGENCPQGATGEICFSGPAVVRGYLNNSAATQATFVDGWLRTGDLGAIDGQGSLRIVGRIKEQINRGGEKISPEHVEKVLASHPDVVQAAVFAVPDDLYGERVAAAVVTRDGSEPDLVGFSRNKLADFEIPDHIAFADELPLTAKGSVNRAKVAERFSP